MNELKPCPFCGGKAIVADDSEQWKVFCTNPDCDAQYGWCASRAYVIKGWNRRVGEQDG